MRKVPLWFPLLLFVLPAFILAATGGPDQYGYTWIDSDEPGGSVFEWIDITEPGSLISELADNNYSTPIDLGFDFYYYTYIFDEVYIGSNGYLKFPRPMNIANPFPDSIPSAGHPNGFIAVSMMDLNLRDEGSVYYWTNDVDSMIVSWIDVPGWNSGGSHTFQIIIDASNYNIRFNYGANTGTVFEDDILIGIASPSEEIGLVHSADEYIPHENYSILFQPPLGHPPAEINDIAILEVFNDESHGFYLNETDLINPQVLIKNVGNQVESIVEINCTITDPNNWIVFDEITVITNMIPGQEEWIDFNTMWTDSILGAYKIEASLSPDDNLSNDNLKTEVQIVHFEGGFVHKYTDWEPESFWEFPGGQGEIAVKIHSAFPYIDIMFLSMYMREVTPGAQFTAKIYAADGPDGLPGTLVYQRTQGAPSGGSWVSVPARAEIMDTTAYIAWEFLDNSTVEIGCDRSMPLSRNTLENRNGWASFRQNETLEPMVFFHFGEG